MSKIGRYSADRKKIEALSDDKTAGDANKVNVHVVAATAGVGVGRVKGSTPVISQQALRFDVSAGAVNDTVEILTDGNTWYAQAICSGSEGVIKA